MEDFNKVTKSKITCAACVKYLNSKQWTSNVPQNFKVEWIWVWGNARFPHLNMKSNLPMDGRAKVKCIKPSQLKRWMIKNFQKFSPTLDYETQKMRLKTEDMSLILLQTPYKWCWKKSIICSSPLAPGEILPRIES
jgi:hypothetical protein